LPEGCCHKIGMGKPLGLGSIKLTSTIHLSDRTKRYSELFAEWNENISESKEDGKTNKDYKNKFADYVMKQVHGSEKVYTAEDLWNEERMKELKRMLTFNHGILNSQISYMELLEFKERPVLPKPTDVK